MGATQVLRAGAIAAVVAAAVILAALPFGRLAASPAPVPPTLSELTSCAILSRGGTIEGTLTFEGGPRNGTPAANLPLAVSYGLLARTINTSTGKVVASDCLGYTTPTSSAPNGSFAVTPGLPPPSCLVRGSSALCTSYEGPYAPVGLVVVGGLPPGYITHVSGLYGPVVVTFVYQFSSLTTSPAGPTATTSVDAPTEVAATVLSAGGTPSELSPTFAWTLEGSGWSLLSPSTGPAVSVRAVPGAGLGELSVVASASQDGTSFGPLATTLALVAVPTEVQTAEVNRTSLDAGGAAAFTLAAVGAAGFVYTASVSPGLGLPTAAAPCTSAASSGGTVSLTCRTTVVYPSAGVAQPTANVTNGHSEAAWRFPDISVASPPSVTVAPGAPSGYVGVPIPITVSAANGTGARPYAYACLAAGAGVPRCTEGPGPSWAFAPTYTSVGEHPARVWAVDAAGENASAGFGVTVVEPLEVGAVAVTSGNASVGSPLALAANVSGGALPLRVWWNVTGWSSPVSVATLGTDGVTTATLVPATAGPLEVTVTLVDALGTVVRGALLVPVGPATATLIAPITVPPAGAVTAGAPLLLAWGAFGPTSTIDRTYAAAATLSVTVPSGPPVLEANASGVGPLAPLGNGTYAVPAAAWVGGVLNVSLWLTTAVTLQVGLGGNPLAAAVPPISLTVAPDRAHLRLSSPSVARAGARENATLWRVSDRFGNAVVGALLTVELELDGTQRDRLVPVAALPDGASGAWINFSAPAGASGQLRVLDAAGEVVLGPLAIPPQGAPQGPGATETAVLTAVPVGLAGVGALVAVRRRRRPRDPEAGAEELRALAEGRARVLELVRAAGAVDLAGLDAAWTPPPAPPALADWLASLLADGTLTAALDEDGRARFRLAEGTARAPRVTIDPAALERSLRRRDGDLDEGAPAEDDR